MKLPKKHSFAFTLVEMLVVMGVILVLLTLAVPAYNAISNASGLTKAAYDLSGTLEQARAYAMANNTYVFVGLQEFDSSAANSATPQTVASTTAGGRLVVAVVASRDGTRGYDVNDPANSWKTNYATGANLISISKLLRFENLHLTDFGATPPASGGMARPVIGDSNYRLSNANTVSVTTFSWPLGTADTAGSGQYYFSKVINIDPQGVMRFQLATNTDAVPSWMELGLQPTHGNAVPTVPADQNSGDFAALQIDAMTGAVRIYRP